MVVEAGFPKEIPEKFPSVTQKVKKRWPPTILAASPALKGFYSGLVSKSLVLQSFSEGCIMTVEWVDDPRVHQNQVLESSTKFGQPAVTSLLKMLQKSLFAIHPFHFPA